MPTSEAQPASCPFAARFATSLPVACAGIYEALATMSPAAIAAELGCTLTDLLDFLQSQPFAQYAAQRNDGWRQAALVLAHGALPDAIDALRAVCTHADNLRERRMAANALLRFIVGRPPPRERPPQPSLPTDMPSGQHHAAAAGAAPSVSPEPPTSSPSDLHPSSTRATDHGSAWSVSSGQHHAAAAGAARSVSPELPADPPRDLHAPSTRHTDHGSASSAPNEQRATDVGSVTSVSPEAPVDRPAPTDLSPGGACIHTGAALAPT